VDLILRAGQGMKMYCRLGLKWDMPSRHAFHPQEMVMCDCGIIRGGVLVRDYGEEISQCPHWTAVLLVTQDHHHI